MNADEDIRFDSGDLTLESNDLLLCFRFSATVLLITFAVLEMTRLEMVLSKCEVRHAPNGHPSFC